MENFNNFTPNLRFTHEHSEKSISFLDLIITVSEQKLKTILHIKLQIAISTYIMPPHAQNILSAQLFSAKHQELVDYVLRKMISRVTDLK